MKDEWDPLPVDPLRLLDHSNEHSITHSMTKEVGYFGDRYLRSLLVGSFARLINPLDEH